MVSTRVLLPELLSPLRDLIEMHGFVIRVFDAEVDIWAIFQFVVNMPVGLDAVGKLLLVQRDVPEGNTDLLPVPPQHNLLEPVH